MAELKRRAQNHRHVRRADVYSTGPLLLVVALSFSCLLFFILSTANWYIAVACTLAIGISYGAVMVIMVVTTAELFGRTHMGSNIGFNYFGTMLATIVLSQFVAAPFTKPML